MKWSGWNGGSYRARYVTPVSKLVSDPKGVNSLFGRSFYVKGLNLFVFERMMNVCTVFLKATLRVRKRHLYAHICV